MQSVGQHVGIPGNPKTMHEHGENEGRSPKKSLLSTVADAGHTSLTIIYGHGEHEERNLKRIPNSMPADARLTTTHGSGGNERRSLK